MLYNPNNYNLHELSEIKKLILPGDDLYVCCHTQNGHFFVKATVTEVSYIHTTDMDEKSIWVLKSLDPNHENNFNKFITNDILVNTKIINQFPWVDWPLGHAAYIGDYGFFTLKEARKICGVSRKKGKYRRARKHFSDVTKFIYETHVSVAKSENTEPPEWPWEPRTYYNRKIYV